MNKLGQRLLYTTPFVQPHTLPVLTLKQSRQA